MGLSGADTLRERIGTGMTTLSALSGAMLEGSVITADSMRARGYGTGAATSYQDIAWHRKDRLLLGAVLLLTLFTAVSFVSGGMRANFLPALDLAPVCGLTLIPLTGYALLLLIPTALHLWEELKWHFLKSNI